MCEPKSLGGLGIKSLQSMNLVMLTKWLWKYATDPSFLWALVIQDHYFRRGRSWTKGQSKFSFTGPIWRNILRQSSFLCSNTKVMLGDGRDCLFWMNSWSPTSPLLDVFPSLYATTKNPSLTMHRAVNLHRYRGGMGSALHHRSWIIGPSVF